MQAILENVPSSFFYAKNSETCTVSYDHKDRPVLIKYDNGTTETRAYFYDNTRKREVMSRTTFDKDNKFVNTLVE